MARVEADKEGNGDFASGREADTPRGTGRGALAERPVRSGRGQVKRLLSMEGRMEEMSRPMVGLLTTRLNRTY